MKLAVIFAASVVGLAACSSSNTPAPEQSGGIEGEGETAATSAPDTNPDGVPYPTDKIGTIPRKGTTAGNRIQNFKFLGYPDGDVSGGLKPVSLAQYFDPTGNRYKIVHIQASGVWCTFCQTETKIVAQLKQDLESRKTVWLISLAEGPTPGTPSTRKDLDGWINEFKAPYTHWLDPGNANLGPFYDRSALPWNCNIDATTMEILTSGTGAHTTKEAVLKDIDDAIEMAAKSELRSPQ